MTPCSLVDASQATAASIFKVEQEVGNRLLLLVPYTFYELPSLRYQKVKLSL
jgi:hypothetical protein